MNTLSIIHSARRGYNALKSIIVGTMFRKCPLSVRFNTIDFLQGPGRIVIGEKTCFGKGVYLTAWAEHARDNTDTLIKIGSNCCFGAYNHITATNCIEVGDNCLTGKWVTISDNNHGDCIPQTLELPPICRKVISKGPVVIGKNVWIGDKATILSGVTIGDGAVIAANSVVTHDVPAHCVAAGNPALIRNKQTTI